MAAETAVFRAEDGTQLFSRRWLPADQAVRALCFICHGLGEHCLYYDEIAQLLTSRGVLVQAHDHRGHGESEGRRAFIKTINVCVNDVLEHVTQTRQQHPNVPLFLLGHSMGGTIAVKCILQQPDWFRGVVLIAPGLKPSPETVSPFLVTMLRFVNCCYPSAKVARIDPTFVSRNLDVVKMYEEDPLVFHDRLSAATAKSILDAIREIEPRMSEVRIPLLILHGTVDKLAHVGGSQMLFERSTSTDKTIKIFDGAFHQVHHELKDVTDVTLALITDWVAQRI